MADPDSPETRRTIGDRMADVSPLVWMVLGILVILLFVGLMFLMGRPEPPIR